MASTHDLPSSQIWSNWDVETLQERSDKYQPLRSVRLLKTRSSAHSKNLVVVLHGLDFKSPLPGEEVDCDHLNSFIRMILLDEGREGANALANALLIDYRNHLFVSNKNAGDLPDAISRSIAQACSSIKAENIILMGHSFGSLLARKVLVDAVEKYEAAKRRGNEHNSQSMSLATSNVDHSWCKHANGLVSLAGTNLGFKIDKVNSWQLKAVAFGAMATSLFAPWLVNALNSRGRLGRLAFYSWRNSDWVVDTRIKWLRFYEGTSKWERSSDGKHPQFKTLSITGTMDALVGEDDQEMVYQLGDLYCSRIVPGVRHEGFLDPEIGKASQAVQAISKDMTLKASIAEDIHVLLDLPTKEPNSFGKVIRVSKLHAGEEDNDEGLDRTVIFLIHGIRDNAEWQEDIDYNLRKTYQVKSDQSRSHGSNIVISQIRYGYFSALQFLFPSERRRAIRSFSDEYLRVMARFPDLKQENIHVYAHSNGTFVFGEALRKYREIKVNRVLLGGSVLPPSFPWKKYVKSFPTDKESRSDTTSSDGYQVMEVINYAANKDAPTGLLCRGLGFIRLPLPKQPPLLGIGPGGTDGFKDLCNYKTAGSEGSVRGWNFFLEGDHGATLATGHQSPKGIAAYLLGVKPNSTDQPTGTPSDYSFDDMNSSENPDHPLKRADQPSTKSFPSLYRNLQGNLIAGVVLAFAAGIFLVLISFPIGYPPCGFKVVWNALALILLLYLLSRL